jgi:serine/threonine-protein kinase
MPVLGGRYRLVERIARGGMGEVWRGFDEVLGRPVAVKVLRPEYADEQVFLERFRNEARNTAALVHTGIAAVYDFGQATMSRTVVPFIVMELVPGQPLSQIIERDGALERDRCLDLVAQAARALNAAHVTGVVHRDVKPANLLITPSWTVKVTDFGISRAGDTLPLTRTGTVMGTAHYLAPELVNGRGVAAPASDIYALGVVLYECLAGHRPFIGDNPLAVAMEHLNSTIPPIPGLHPAIVEVLDATLAKEPEARPATAEQLAHRLLALRIELAAGEPTPEAVARSLGEQADTATVRRAASRSRSGGHRRATPNATRTPDPRAVPVPTPRSAPSTEVATEPGLEIPLLSEAAPAERAGRHRAPVATGHGRPPRSNRRRTLALGTAAGVVVIGIGALWLTDKDPSTAVVPAVEGSAEHDATRELTAVGFTIKVDRKVDEAVPAGVVLKQTPAGGTRANSHSAVSILVSAGPQRVEVALSSWQGKAYAEVAHGLQQLGLQVRRRDVATGGSPGTVTDVSPRGQVPVGSPVTVTVVSTSSGTAPALASAATGRNAR